MFSYRAQRTLASSALITQVSTLRPIAISLSTCDSYQSLGDCSTGKNLILDLTRANSWLPFKSLPINSTATYSRSALALRGYKPNSTIEIIFHQNAIVNVTIFCSPKFVLNPPTNSFGHQNHSIQDLLESIQHDLLSLVSWQTVGLKSLEK